VVALKSVPVKSSADFASAHSPVVGLGMSQTLPDSESKHPKNQIGVPSSGGPGCSSSQPAGHRGDAGTERLSSLRISTIVIKSHAEFFFSVGNSANHERPTPHGKTNEGKPTGRAENLKPFGFISALSSA
jgi:hypothetical protein